ncbi:hypothetical protein [Brevibacillus borstelensis]
MQSRMAGAPSMCQDYKFDKRVFNRIDQLHDFGFRQMRPLLLL